MMENKVIKPLVSLITPCYNMERFIQRYFDSIINQHYNNIELILVNDGSTDDTEKIILSNKLKLEKNGIKVIYIKQENAGVSEAINTGLKVFSGKYLSWPDPDDYFEDNSIEKRVTILENNPQYAIVTCNAYIRDVDNLQEYQAILGKSIKERFEENQFDFLLYEKSTFCPICHLIRSEAFLESHPTKTIYGAKRSANWQLLLPLYYKYKRIYLDEVLCSYIIHGSNISMGDDTKEKAINRLKEHQNILVKTIERIDMKDEIKKDYLTKIDHRYTMKKLSCASRFGDKDLLESLYEYLKEKKLIKFSDRIIYLKYKYISSNTIYHKLKLLINKII